MELLDEHLTRQSDIIPRDILKVPITIIGAGAVGSFTALQLAKMGCEDISVWDFDKVSVENMNCQFYRFKDIGKDKAGALYDLVRDFTNVKIKAHHVAYCKTDDLVRGILVTAVDSMKSRKMIWECYKEKSVFLKAYIDPRMGAEDCALYIVDPNDPRDIKSYENTLYSDEDAVQERCTAKSTIYTANLLSGTVVQSIKDVLMGAPISSLQWSIKKYDLMVFKKPGVA